MLPAAREWHTYRWCQHLTRAQKENNERLAERIASNSMNDKCGEIESDEREKKKWLGAFYCHFRWVANDTVREESIVSFPHPQVLCKHLNSLTHSRSLYSMSDFHRTANGEICSSNLYKRDRRWSGTQYK